MTRTKLSLLLSAAIAASGLSASAFADFGVRATGPDSGVIYFQDDNYEGAFSYMCYNGCYQATLTNGYWERDVTGVSNGQVLAVSTQIQDNEAGQILENFEVTFDPSVTTGGSVDGPDDPVNILPTVSVSDASGDLTELGNFTVDATASDSDGSIASVDWFVSAPGQTETLVESDLAAPYSLTVANLTAGTYSVRALATDNKGAMAEDTTSVVVSEDPVVLDPYVEITSPVDNATFNLGEDVTVQFSIQNFEIVDGGRHLHLSLNGNNTTIFSGSSYTYSNLAVGDYVVVAELAEADHTEIGVNDSISFSVVEVANVLPTVSVALENGVVEGESIAVTANASDADGDVLSVEFFVTAPGQTEQPLATVVNPPYEATIENTVPGTYQVRVVAEDNEGATSEATKSTIVKSDDPVVIIPSGRGEMGIDDKGMLYHLDGGHSAGWVYLCFNGPCTDAKPSLKDGYYEMPVSVEVGGTYQIEFKTQDNATGQCLSGVHTVTYTAEGVTADSACIVPDVDAPTIPTGLQGAAKNGHAIQISWTASIDDRAVALYEVYVNGGLNQTVTGTSANVVNLSELSTYSFAVLACDASENCSGLSDAVDIATPKYVPDTTPPTAPTGASAEALSMTKVAMSWNASTDEEGLVSEYRVFDGNDLVATASETTVEVTGLVKSTDYSFTVTACDDSGNCSKESDPVAVRTLSPDFSFLDWTSNSFVTGKPAGPLPRANPIRALRTPVNGLAPRTFGFAFDLVGNQVTWRFGGSVPQAGGLEVSCSEDGHFTFKTAKFNGDTATMPCSGTYDYFFRYLHPHSLNSDPAHQWIYTGLFTTEGERIDPYAPGAYSFTDGTANWARIRHPITTDGITAAVLDRPNAGERLRNLDRYTMWVNDNSGNVDFEMDVSFMEIGAQGVPSDVVPGFRRNEALRAAHGSPNSQQFFAVNTAAKFGDAYRTAPQEELEGFGDTFSYGQVISFEFSVEAAGKTPAQTYNDFSHYVVGCGFCGKYGDPRLNSAGKASTSQVFSDAGQYIGLERNAIFTQPVTTLNTEVQIDNFILGHHLFHGIDPNIENSNSELRNKFGHVKIGEFACGDCHWRDGRSTEYFHTPRGQRIAPPTYGTKLLEYIPNREVGFRWDGGAWTVEDQAKNALRDDHLVDWKDLPGDVFQRIIDYVEVLTVPARNPGTYDDPDVVRGEVLFTEAGCADCHTPTHTTLADAPPAWRNLTIRPYTDMKVWDLGTAGPDQVDTKFRTAPLWGIGQNLKLAEYNNNYFPWMHDGESAGVDASVQRHNVEGQYSKDAYNAMPEADRQAIVKFVRSL